MSYSINLIIAWQILIKIELANQNIPPISSQIVAFPNTLNLLAFLKTQEYQDILSESG